MWGLADTTAYSTNILFSLCAHAPLCRYDACEYTDVPPPPFKKKLADYALEFKPQLKEVMGRDEMGVNFVELERRAEAANSNSNDQASRGKAAKASACLKNVVNKSRSAPVRVGMVHSYEALFSGVCFPANYQEQFWLRVQMLPYLRQPNERN